MKSPIYLCPNCATFELKDNKGFECSNCGSAHKTRHLKLTHDYAAHVYLYGHLYRKDYQKQVDENGKIVIYYCLEPDSIYKFIGLAMLSGVIGNLAWDLVKIASKKIISEYNSVFDKNHEISESELHDVYKSFEIFINNSDKIDKKVMGGIIEEMFAHESGNVGKKLALNNLKQMGKEDQTEKEQLRKENAKLIKNISKTLRKKIQKKQEAAEEDFSNYWGKIKVE
jgi:hypothetical protein